MYTLNSQTMYKKRFASIETFTIDSRIKLHYARYRKKWIICNLSKPNLNCYRLNCNLKVIVIRYVVFYDRDDEACSYNRRLSIVSVKSQPFHRVSINHVHCISNTRHNYWKIFTDKYDRKTLACENYTLRLHQWNFTRFLSQSSRIIMNYNIK